MPPAKAALPPPVVTAGREGFSFKSADGSFLLKLRGVFQLDARFFKGDAAKLLSDTFTLGRIRPILEGTVAKYFDFLLVEDFGRGQTFVQDAYADVPII